MISSGVLTMLTKLSDASRLYSHMLLQLLALTRPSRPHPNHSALILSLSSHYPNLSTQQTIIIHLPPYPSHPPHLQHYCTTPHRKRLQERVGGCPEGHAIRRTLRTLGSKVAWRLKSLANFSYIAYSPLTFLSPAGPPASADPCALRSPERFA